MILFYVTYFPICYCHLQVTQNGITDWIAITVLWRKEETPLVKSICQTCCQFCLLLYKFIEQLQKKEINVKLLVNFDLWKKRKKTDTKVTFHLVNGHLVSYERDGKNKTFLLWCFCTYFALIKRWLMFHDRKFQTLKIYPYGIDKIFTF